MSEDSKDKRSGKMKGFLKGMIEKLDKKMKEEARARPCCCKPSGKEKDSCCS